MWNQYIFIIEQALSNKSSFVQTLILQNTQTLQLFTMNIKTDIITKVFKI
jgi:hypothetical protein